MNTFDIHYFLEAKAALLNVSVHELKLVLAKKYLQSNDMVFNDFELLHEISLADFHSEQ